MNRRQQTRNDLVDVADDAIRLAHDKLPHHHGCCVMEGVFAAAAVDAVLKTLKAAGWDVTAVQITVNVTSPPEPRVVYVPVVDPCRRA